MVDGGGRIFGDRADQLPPDSAGAGSISKRPGDATRGMGWTAALFSPPASGAID